MGEKELADKCGPLVIDLIIQDEPDASRTGSQSLVGGAPGAKVLRL
jgi:hypothetical protein